jgi:DNA-binding Lrp family transcriptional regulator
MIGEKDRVILARLLEDGRKSVVEIAGELGIPRTTVQERLKKMVSEGIIKKFVAIPDYSKLGKQVTAYILVSFSGGGTVSQRGLAEEIAKIPEVYEVSLISGEWDILLKVRAASVEQVGELVIDKLRMMRGIEKTQTCVSFNTIKEGF